MPSKDPATYKDQPIIVTLHDAKGREIGFGSWSSGDSYSRSLTYRGGVGIGHILNTEKKRSCLGSVHMYAPLAYTNDQINFGILTHFQEGMRLSSEPDAYVTVEGDVICGYDGNEEIFSTETGLIKAKFRAEILRKFKVGTVKLEGDIGVAYNNDGVKVGEVRNGGEYAAVYAGAIFQFFNKQ
jgi:hypothetical protein